MILQWQGFVQAGAQESRSIRHPAKNQGAILCFNYVLNFYAA
jgi:hypothetical protein